MQTEKLSATNKRRDCKEDLSNQDISNKTQREGKFQSCQLGHFSQNERNEQEKKKRLVVSPITATLLKAKVLPMWNSYFHHPAISNAFITRHVPTKLQTHTSNLQHSLPLPQQHRTHQHEKYHFKFFFRNCVMCLILGDSTRSPLQPHA